MFSKPERRAYSNDELEEIAQHNYRMFEKLKDIPFLKPSTTKYEPLVNENSENATSIDENPTSTVENGENATSTVNHSDSAAKPRKSSVDCNYIEPMEVTVETKPFKKSIFFPDYNNTYNLRSRKVPKMIKVTYEHERLDEPPAKVAKKFEITPQGSIVSSVVVKKQPNDDSEDDTMMPPPKSYYLYTLREAFDTFRQKNLPNGSVIGIFMFNRLSKLSYEVSIHNGLYRNILDFTEEEMDQEVWPLPYKRSVNMDINNSRDLMTFLNYNSTKVQSVEEDYHPETATLCSISEVRKINLSE